MGQLSNNLVVAESDAGSLIAAATVPTLPSNCLVRQASSSLPDPPRRQLCDEGRCEGAGRHALVEGLDGGLPLRRGHLREVGLLDGGAGGRQAEVVDERLADAELDRAGQLHLGVLQRRLADRRGVGVRRFTAAATGEDRHARHEHRESEPDPTPTAALAWAGA